jgi:hypothetical protein
MPARLGERCQRRNGEQKCRVVTGRLNPGGLIADKGKVATADVVTQHAPERTDRRLVTVIYTATAALASTLLFVVQPLAVRMLLPLLGGSAAVWNSALVFFQSALLVGYLLAHQGRLRLPWAARPWIQIAGVALGLVVLPVALPGGWEPPSDAPSLWVLSALLVMVGLPFIALATLSPTIQAWLAETDHPRAEEPYFLYAAGNAGSVGGLLAYPLILEPLFGLQDQARLWAVGYALLIGLLIASAALRRRHLVSARRPESFIESEPPSRAMKFRWIAMAAVPSGLLVAVTQHITTDVAAIPLLWVLPLAIYLGTFIVAFGTPRSRVPVLLVRAAMIAAIPLAASLVGQIGSLMTGLLIHLGGFAILALTVHIALATQRPEADQLTAYYLWISVGGLIGGVAVALVAPIVFDRILEYPLLVAAALIIIGGAATPAGDKSQPSLPGMVVPALVVAATGAVIWFAGSDGDGRMLVGAVAIGLAALYLICRDRPRAYAASAAVLLVVTAMTQFEPALSQSRSFFGVVRVTEEDRTHQLEHGSTIHGAQEWWPEPSTEPLTYYRRGSGVGRLFAATRRSDPTLEVGVIGLGAGTLAAYGNTGDFFDFYEIDADVARIASDPTQFTFLEATAADFDVTVVDGRIGVERSERTYDVIVLDAFSSDAIPVHLLTAEAIAAYADKLDSDGAIAAHISNRYFDLGPVIARLAEEVDMRAWKLDEDGSTWVVLAPEVRPQEVSTDLADWEALTSPAGTPLWTDDYVNLLSALRSF